MRRREFMTLLGGVSVAWPLATRGQQPARPVIGFLNAGSPAAFSELAAAFRRGLDEAGYVEGQNILIEYRWAEGRFDRLPALAADLVNRRVAVIASTGGNAVVEAAAAATTTVPIVFLGSDVALKTGVIAALNRPSGNVTGVVMSTSALLSKCLQFLGELVPKDATIGVLVNPNSPTTIEDKEDIQTAARQIGRQIFILTADKEAEIDTAFATLAERHAGGLVVQGDILYTNRRERRVEESMRPPVSSPPGYRRFGVSRSWSRTRPAPAATLPANSPHVPTPTATRSTTPRYHMRQVAISIARSATTRSLTSPPSR